MSCDGITGVWYSFTPSRRFLPPSVTCDVVADGHRSPSRSRRSGQSSLWPTRAEAHELLPSIPECVPAALRWRCHALLPSDRTFLGPCWGAVSDCGVIHTRKGWSEATGRHSAKSFQRNTFRATLGSLPVDGRARPCGGRRVLTCSRLSKAAAGR